MSIKTWRAEFFDESVRFQEMSMKQATEHALKKWQGALPENLKKHNLKIAQSQCVHYIKLVEDAVPYSSAEFIFGVHSCSLCQKYVEEDLNCKRCPLVKANSNYECCTIGSSDPYSIAGETKDPTQMIAALEDTLAKINSGEIKDDETTGTN